MSFQWFGENNPVPLGHIRQISGMHGIVSAICGVPVGEVWPIDTIEALKTKIESHGLAFEVIESAPVHEDIKLGKANYLLQAGGFSLSALGTLGMLPALLAIPGGWLGGYLSDRLLKLGWTATRACKTCLVGGIQNFAGNLAGILITTFTGVMLTITNGSFLVPLSVAGALYVVGALSYLFIVGKIEPLPPIKGRSFPALSPQPIQ